MRTLNSIILLVALLLSVSSCSKEEVSVAEVLQTSETDQISEVNFPIKYSIPRTALIAEIEAFTKTDDQGLQATITPSSTNQTLLDIRIDLEDDTPQP